MPTPSENPFGQMPNIPPQVQQQPFGQHWSPFIPVSFTFGVMNAVGPNGLEKFHVLKLTTPVGEIGIPFTDVGLDNLITMAQRAKSGLVFPTGPIPPTN